VFNSFFGLPAHPLLVHFAAVLIPLMVLAAIAYALVPRIRRHIAWAVLGLAVVGPLTAFAAKQSGVAFRTRLLHDAAVSNDPKELSDLLAKQSAISTHESWANGTLWVTLVLGVLMVLLVFVHVARARRPKKEGDSRETTIPAKGSHVLTIALTVATVGIAGMTGFYVFKTGDTGAHIVWGGK
jgi:hypothetical protein